MSRDLPKLSAIVVAHRRPVLVRNCLRSLLSQSEPELEVVVVMNDAGADTEKVLTEMATLDERVKLVRCSRVSASEARNHGVSMARAPILYFVDDDVEVPTTGVAAVLDVYGARPNVSFVGGPNLTHPEDRDFAQLTGELLASFWGTGIARPRYAKVGPHAASERDLILCNLAVSRAVFEQGARFPLHFGGEENVLLGAAHAKGYDLWYSPEVWVHHHRRGSLRAYVDQMRRYGRGRAIALAGAPRTFHVAYFVPVGFVAYLVLLPGLAFWTAAAWAPLAAYAFGCAATSLAIAARKRSGKAIFLLPPLFLMTHVSYAAGLMEGLVRGSFGKRHGARDKAAPNES